MSTTNINPKMETNSRRSCRMTKPKIVGYHGVDEDRKYISGDSSIANMKYLKLPKAGNVKFDLNIGMENVMRKDEDFAGNEKLNSILSFIVENQRKLTFRSADDDPEKKKFLDYDFVSYRGLLRQIMCTPFEQQTDWCICATKFKDTIYLCTKETENNKMKRRENAQNETLKKILSYGFKFEQYVLVDDPSKDPDITKPVNECMEWNCVFETKLERLRLFYAAEIDGIDSPTKVDLNEIDPSELKLVEVKVKLREQEFYQMTNYYRFKLLNWWCQCFLVGINEVVVGIRNYQGIVDEIEIVKLDEIPKDECKKYWSQNACVNFLELFLQTVKSIMRDVDCPYTVYEFYYNPTDYKPISYKVLEGKNDSSFLAEWYIDAAKKGQSANVKL